MAREAETTSRVTTAFPEAQEISTGAVGCVEKEDSTREGRWVLLMEAELRPSNNSCCGTTDVILQPLEPNDFEGTLLSLLWLLFSHEISFFIVKSTILMKPHLHFLTLLKATFFFFYKNNSTAEHCLCEKRKQFLYIPSSFSFPLMRDRNKNV